MTEVIRSDNRVTKSRWAFWSSKFRYYRKGHDNDHRVKFLTKSQRQNVVRSWEKVPNKRALGEEIYIQIFMHKPMLKSLFPFRTVPVDQLRNNALFTRQAAIFADFIDCVVGYLAINNGNLIMELSERVGVNHALMTSVNFDPEWWVLFANSVLDCIRQYCEPKFICLPISRHITRKIMIAWRILLKEVVDRMSEAFIQRRELDIRQENNCDPNAQLVESAVKQNHSEDDDLNNPNLEIFDLTMHCKESVFPVQPAKPVVPLCLLFESCFPKKELQHPSQQIQPKRTHSLYRQAGRQQARVCAVFMEFNQPDLSILHEDSDTVDVALRFPGLKLPTLMDKLVNFFKERPMPDRLLSNERSKVDKHNSFDSQLELELTVRGDDKKETNYRYVIRRFPCEIDVHRARLKAKQSYDKTHCFLIIEFYKSRHGADWKTFMALHGNLDAG
ncbi:globin [Trichinella nativa]|uniref:Globin n=1 Tax=Trichinella nativa TaxID=6335 RepID=A0A1Y3EGL3_9BILA|nr:globin [Trichinella nativa]